MKNLLRNVNRILPESKKYQNGFFIGAILFLIGILVFQDQEEKRPSAVFKTSGVPDFKNASILGDPSKALLRDEEQRFVRTQKNLLDAQNQLKKEVESLRSELSQLKSVETPPNPNPSPASSVQPRLVPEDNPFMIPNKEHTSVSHEAETNVTVGEEFNHTNFVRSSQSNDSLIQSRKAMNQAPGTLAFDVPLERKKLGKSVLSFPVKAETGRYLKSPGIILPSGSYVKAVLLTGIEAPEGRSYPVLVQLDYAYIIPNDKKLDLKGCFAIAKAQGDLSTERVQMQATKLSCVSRRGGMFEREINGFIADNVDNSFAVMGKVNSKQDRVAATAFLASIVSGIGRAVQQAQTTQQATPLGGGQSIVTGDQTKFIAAGGASEAANMVTQWYLKQAQNLLPTINVGSGQVVWIVMQDQVKLPKDYFQQNNYRGNTDATLYSYLTRLID